MGSTIRRQFREQGSQVVEDAPNAHAMDLPRGEVIDACRVSQGIHL